ncbi:hypothetical protein GOE02_21550 [Sinorhizobium medicae]|nr:hypothetical protein [Sinorhizobium medicae]
MGALKIESIFCEDIRLEATQKHILIGVFSDEVLVHTTPANIGIALWLRIHGIAVGKHKIHIEAYLESGDERKLCGEISADLEVLRPGRATVINSPTLVIPVEKDGMLKYFISFDDEPPQDAGTLIVTVVAPNSKLVL